MEIFGFWVTEIFVHSNSNDFEYSFLQLLYHIHYDIYSFEIDYYTFEKTLDVRDHLAQLVRRKSQTLKVPSTNSKGCKKYFSEIFISLPQWRCTLCIWWFYVLSIKIWLKTQKKFKIILGRVSICTAPKSDSTHKKLNMSLVRESKYMYYTKIWLNSKKVQYQLSE